MGTNETQNASATEMDDQEMLLNMLIEAAKRLWCNIKRVSSYMMQEMGGYQVFEKTAHWCFQHPHISICMLAGGFVMFLPFLILVGIGLSTVVMTFTGFLFLEGTLLTVVSILMIGCLGSLFFVLLILAVFIVAAYFGCTRIYDMYIQPKAEEQSQLKSGINICMSK